MSGKSRGQAEQCNSPHRLRKTLVQSRISLLFLNPHPQRIETRLRPISRAQAQVSLYQEQAWWTFRRYSNAKVPHST
jgi:hypothetical protein